HDPGHGRGGAGGAAGDLPAAAGLDQVAVVAGGGGQGQVREAAVLVLRRVGGHPGRRLPTGLGVEGGVAAAGGPEAGAAGGAAALVPGLFRDVPEGRGAVRILAVLPVAARAFVELGAAHRHVVGRGCD